MLARGFDVIGQVRIDTRLYDEPPKRKKGQRGRPRKYKRVFGLVIDFGASQPPKSTRPLTTYWCPSRPGHQALRNNFASSLLLRTCLPMTGRRVRRPTLFSLWRKARRENSAVSRLLGTTSLRFALHGWQRGRKYTPKRIAHLKRSMVTLPLYGKEQEVRYRSKVLMALPLIEWAPII